MATFEFTRRAYVIDHDHHRNIRYRLRCGVCGILTVAEYCDDCREVYPEVTKGGLSGRDLAKERAAERNGYLDLASQCRGSGARNITLQSWN